MIILTQENQDSYSTGWCTGENDRNGERGDFPTECVYLLPTMTKPPAEILVYKSLLSLISSLIFTKKRNIFLFKSNYLLYNQWKKQMK